MACYVLGCEKCDIVIEKICSFEQSGQIKCEKCGELMKRIPARPRFRIEGYSSLNNYTKPEFDYQGRDVEWGK